MIQLRNEDIDAAVRHALEEDIGVGDATTLATIPEKCVARASIVCRQDLVVCGLDFAERTFLHTSPGVETKRFAADGDYVVNGKVLIQLQASARGLLTGERVALNFLQRLSGIATMTAAFVKAVEGTPAKILDTRKTTPGWRLFEKYAVRCGGALNHRFGLYDMILVKDNHLAALRDEKPNAIAAAVQRARRAYPELKVEVEADTVDQVSQAVAAGADIVLLDNMTPGQMKQAAEICRGRIRTEASGGVRLSTVKAIAETGVDFISVGALTHSAPAVDIALDFMLEDFKS